MLIQIAVLGWIFLGETISLQEGIGMLVAARGVVIVQMRMRAIRTPQEKVKDF